MQPFSVFIPATDQTLFATPRLNFVHYLGLIGLYEFSTTAPGLVTLHCASPGFLMVASLADNSCQMRYQPAGSFETRIPSGPGQVLVIDFKADWIIHLAQETPELLPLVYSFQQHGPVKTLPSFGLARYFIKGFLSLYPGDHPLFEDKAYPYLRGCLAAYLRQLRLQNSANDHYLMKTSALANYLRQHFSSPLAEDLSSISIQLMVSQRQLYRLAHMAFGISFHQQLIKLRMQSAMVYLLTTNKSIQQISELTGYKDPYYFRKAFKKCFGLSPRQLTRG